VDLKKLTIGARYKSFRCALRGIAAVIRTQPNTWYMLAGTVGTVIAGVAFRIEALEWGLVCSAITLVWMGEIFNSALEFLTDLVSPEHHPLAEKTKDAAAGAVFLAVCYSLAIAAIVFGPRLLALVP